MSFEHKGPASASNFEIDPRDLTYQKQQAVIRFLNGVRVGLASLALLSGITILGTSANALMIYNNTHVSSEFYLALWPEKFDIRPTVALVVGSSVVIVANLVSLIFSKVKVNQTLVHSSIAFLAPFVGFAAALIGISFFYAVNASTTVDTLQSWSCQWSYTDMRVQPYFGTLCRQSEAALYLSVILVPVEFIALMVAGGQMGLERKTKAFVPAKPSSPALS
ncbi:hypothetical protein O1611_g8856 [Lasiodiplodia mahajangana]|uniref:Uncharacterized protein n=1 Tax=Lasiodiplodia mahajangana TaxID=1108764 RepID=A0ACC2JBG1_9PEZI|nr:hypothetical protein O1611_g8856 [Lasiodiplodia mahajangana]